MPLAIGHAVDGTRFELPDDAVSQTFAILGKRGSGKSNTGVVMAERMWANRHQFVVIDGKGDWYGMRAPGTGPGIEVPVFGGDHGDLPLVPTAGALMAELIVDEGMSCILDISEFDTKADQIRFLTDLGVHLYRVAKRAPAPLHLFLEEADEWLPQMVTGDITPRCVGAWTKIVKLGRTAGLGATLITQRSASINKGALTQVDTLIATRTTSPNDRKVIAEWVKGEVDGAALLEQLPRLDPGQALVWSPHYLGTTQLVTFDRRSTFDSGATPKPGQRREVPTLAQINLGTISSRMDAVAAEAAENDPRELKKRVRELEKLLTEMKPAVPEPVVTEVEVRVPFIPNEWRLELEALRTQVEGLIGDAERWSPDETTPATTTRTQISMTRDPETGVTVVNARTPAAPATPAGPPPPGPDVRTDNAPTKILTAAALHPGRNKDQLAALAGYAVGKSTVRNALSTLKAAGFTRQEGSAIYVTDLGLEALGPIQPLPTGPELVAHWRAQLGQAEQACFDALLADPDRTFTKQTMGDETGYDPEKSTLRNAMSRLRSLSLADGWRLHPDLRDALGL